MDSIEQISVWYIKKEKDGGAGYRSPCPSHAKRVLYHLSYTPIQRIDGEKRQDVESI